MKTAFILYVEDNLDDVLLLKAAFKLGGFNPEMEIARDGVEALDKLRKEKRKPDLIMLDLNLPKKNGYEVLSELKKDSHLCAIPVIVYSGSANRKDAQICIKMGAMEFLAKPADMDEILKVVKRLKEVLP